MDWKYLFTSLEGRIGREMFWRGILAMIIVTFVAAILDMLLGTMNRNGVGIISGLAALVMIYPQIVLYAKRWHDRNKSGWWSLIALVPVIGGLWLLIECGFLRGTEGDNRFGPDPLRG